MGEDMTTWFAGDVIANGIKIHCHRTGGDKPAVVMVHGTADNGACWVRVARALAQDYDVIAYDRRGHGLSDAPASGYSFEDQAPDLAGLISALDLARPRVIGHSGGAAIAAAAAAKYPDLLACVVLGDPPWVRSREDWEAMCSRLRPWFLGLRSRARGQWIARLRESHPDRPEEEVVLWVDSKLQVHPNVVQEFEQAELPWRDTVRQITCPILLVTGDGIITPQVAQEAADLWREGSVVRFDGAGHDVHRDRYDRYIEVVKAFLEEVDAREAAAH